MHSSTCLRRPLALVTLPNVHQCESASVTLELAARMDRSDLGDGDLIGYHSRSFRMRRIPLDSHHSMVASTVASQLIDRSAVLTAVMTSLTHKEPSDLAHCTLCR